MFFLAFLVTSTVMTFGNAANNGKYAMNDPAVIWCDIVDLFRLNDPNQG